jgi:uncharacterized RDD family membrane protein YckC
MMDASTAAGVTASAAYAGFWRRFGGALIDGIIVAVVEIVLSRLFGVAGGAGALLGVILALIFGIGYYIWGWGNGQTVGCMALDLRMVDAASGGTPGYGRAALRLIGQVVLGIIPIIGVIGDLWMIWDGRKQTWQDKIAGTIVVMA